MWYRLLSWPLWRVIAVCHFINNVMWHYYWYCGKEVKRINPQLWSHSRNTPFLEVVVNAWRWRDRDGG